ncbi:MAG: SpoIIE family protein phosphatase, partial [Clostridia bacterium]|nr:SpoIIE family protein phosphatase [Clostridia bacterium]
TRAVGVTQEVRADYDTVTLEKGDRLLLCSDGLSNMLSDAVIAEILSGEDVPMLAQTLIQTANLAGGEDNVTAVVIAERCDLT